jgi:hypothetical protein
MWRMEPRRTWVLDSGEIPAPGGREVALPVELMLMRELLVAMPSNLLRFRPQRVGRVDEEGEGTEWGVGGEEGGSFSVERREESEHDRQRGSLGSSVRTHFMKNPATKSRVSSASKKPPLTGTGKTIGGRLDFARSRLAADDNPGVRFDVDATADAAKAMAGSMGCWSSCRREGKRRAISLELHISVVLPSDMRRLTFDRMPLDHQSRPSDSPS